MRKWFLNKDQKQLWLLLFTSNWWNGATNAGLISLRTLSIAIVENVTELARLLKALNAWTEIWGCQFLRCRTIKFKNNSSCHFPCQADEMASQMPAWSPFGLFPLWLLRIWRNSLGHWMVWMLKLCSEDSIISTIKLSLRTALVAASQDQTCQVIESHKHLNWNLRMSLSPPLNQVQQQLQLLLFMSN
jgi:hypothetical protein